MAITNFDKVFTVENYEYGFAVEDFAPVNSGDYIKLYIPKLMGNINYTGSDTVNVNGVIINSKVSKLKYSNKVMNLDYIPVKVIGVTDWSDKIHGDGLIHKGEKFIVEFINGNIQTPYVTTK